MLTIYGSVAMINIFVLTPDKVIEKYKDDMDYTKFNEGETRSNEISHFPSGYD